MSGAVWPVGGVPTDERTFCSPSVTYGVVTNASGEVLIIDGVLYGIPFVEQFCDDVVVWQQATSQGSWLESWADTRSYERTPYPSSGSWLTRRFRRDNFV